VLDFSIGDPLLDGFTGIALGSPLASGAAPGEALAAIRTIMPGDDAAWHQAWSAMADRLAGEAQASASRGHKVSAREAYLRAGTYYGIAYRPLFGVPVDPLLKESFGRQMSALASAASLFDPPFEPLAIPYEETNLPGHFVPAACGGRKPLLIATNGYDATIHDMCVYIALAARARGYHSLIFDGPGQGAILIEHNVTMRPDWERVVTPVVDYALTRSDVDPDRIALMGWSLGGYLAPRAASGEHRLAALIADPGVFSPFNMMKQMMGQFGVPQTAIEALPEADDTVLAAMSQAVNADRQLRWSVMQRGFWVMGARSLAEFIRNLAGYTLAGRAGEIRCPTLLTAAENDPVSNTAKQLYDALDCKKTLMTFTAAEGAGDHCEGLNRPLFHQRAFDWLDDLFGAR
jgi:pimeloyl-ACP methyl ester carboxylesterase